MDDFFYDTLEEGETRGERTKRAILQAGMEVFGTHGLEGARTREIADRAGQNISALHYYFGGKEGLYEAVLCFIGDYMGGKIGGELEGYRKAGGGIRPEAARKRLERLFLVVLEAGIANEKTLPVSMIVMREQMSPSAAFNPVYERFFEPLHRGATELLGIWKGISPEDPVCVARAHALLGQVFIFRLGREMLLRRTGWKKIGEVEMRVIREAIEKNLEDLG